MEKISPIKERILQFIDNQNIVKTVFFKNAGVSYANFKGKSLFSDLGSEKIAKILTAYKNISPDWLLNGKGSMLKSDLNITNGDVSHSNIQQGNYINDVAAFYKLQESFNVTLHKKDQQIDELIKIINKLTSNYSKNENF